MKLYTGCMTDLITSSPDLADFCDEARQNDFIAVDTEFVRMRTFWPHLCLVQVATAQRAVAIDALADRIDLAPLGALMADRTILKVFHAARQDVEIFLHHFGAVPQPLFDTQAAAMVCGFGESVGFEVLVRKLAKLHIDKSQRFTDWSRRPLSTAQLHYALNDVIHLRTIHQAINQMLDQNGRKHWLDEEIAMLSDPATYRIDPQDCWQRIKRRGNHPKSLVVLRALAAWREIEAHRRNLPRKYILRDETLLGLAAARPKTIEELAQSRHFPPQRADQTIGKVVLETIKTALSSPPESWPQPPTKPEQSHQDQSAIALLKLLLKMVCDTHGVAPRLVASHADIEAIVAGDDTNIPALCGWRRDIFGADALNVKAGKQAITLHDGMLRLIEIPNQPTEMKT